MICKIPVISYTPFIALAACGALFAAPASGQTVLREQGKLVASNGESSDFFARVIASDGGLVVVGAKLADGAALNSGSAYIFDAQTGQQLVHLFPNDGAEDDWFGNAVAISGSVVAIGAQNDDDHGEDSGAVYLFDTSTGEQLFKLTPDDGDVLDRFGKSVALGENVIAIGALNDSDRGEFSGSVYIFDLTTGQQLTKLNADDGIAGDWFGDTVSIDGNTLAVGSPNTDNPESRTGSAYLFDITTGVQLHHLIASDASGGDLLGRAIAFDNGIVALGVPEDTDLGTDSGSVYLFDAATGQQIHKLLASDGSTSDQFGMAVDIQDGIVVVGARRNDASGTNAGAAYLFDASTGQELAKLFPEYGQARDFLGEGVSIDNGLVAVGARSENNSGNTAGVVYTFDISGLTFQDQAYYPNRPEWIDEFGYAIAVDNGKVAIGAPRDGEVGEQLAGAAYLFDVATGQQIHKFFADDAGFSDKFGRSISLDNNIVAVGSPLSNEIGSNAGSVYLFDAITGQQIFKLLADDANGGDIFGHSVSIDNGIVAVGAYADDDNGLNSGAAYTFDALTGQQLAKLLPSDGFSNDQFGISIAISDGLVVVGSHNDDDLGNGSGSVYIFDAQTGEQRRKILPDDGFPGDKFGASVAISNGLVAVGAIEDNDSGFDAGSAYVFDLETGEQLAKFLPADGADIEQFGWSVAINSETLVVGMRLSEFSGDYARGKAYIFDINTGEQLTKLLPTDGRRGDYFGSAVSIDENTVAVGAPYLVQSSNHTGSAYTYTVGDPVCPGDLTEDGIVDFFDVSAFLQLFAAQDPAIDYTEDGIIDFFDISVFLQLFAAGCP